MEAYYKEMETTPAHLIKEKTMYTTYRNDNAFDRVALSQLTGGDKPGELSKLRRASLANIIFIATCLEV